MANDDASGRIVTLTLVGSIAGVIAERVLGQVSTAGILIASAVAVMPALKFVKARSGPGQNVTDTIAWTVGVAAITGAATVLARRGLTGASLTARLIVLAVIAAIAVALVVWINRRAAAAKTR